MIHIYIIPKEFIIAYNLQETVNNDYIYLRVTKGIYGLPQAGRISYDSLV